jgi:hypothetical protein
MPRTFVLTVAVCVWGFVAAVALADKGDPAEQNEKARLLKQIAELKAMVAKLRDVAAHQQAQSEKQRAVAEQARLAAEKRLAEHQKRQFAEKGFQKGPHPGHREAMEKLENIRAAVKHLKAAGLNDVAAAVAKHGEQIQAAIEKSPQPGSFKPGQFKGGKPRFLKGGPQPPFKGGKPQFFKGGPQPPFKGGKPTLFKGGPPQFVRGPQPPHFKGGPVHKPADGALMHHLAEMGAAIGRLSKQVEQLQKAVAELQKRK